MPRCDFEHCQDDECPAFTERAPLPDIEGMSFDEAKLAVSAHILTEGWKLEQRIANVHLLGGGTPVDLNNEVPISLLEVLLDQDV